MVPYREAEQDKPRFFLGTNCHVVCVDRITGKTVWQTRIQKALGSMLVTLLLYQDYVYAACHQVVVALDVHTGQIAWKTKTKLAEPASLALHPGVKGGLLIAAAGGRLVGLVADSGAPLWENSLPGLRYYPICLRVPGAVVAQPMVRQVSTGDSSIIQLLESDQYDAS